MGQQASYTSIPINVKGGVPGQGCTAGGSTTRAADTAAPTTQHATRGRWQLLLLQYVQCKHARHIMFGVGWFEISCGCSDGRHEQPQHHHTSGRLCREGQVPFRFNLARYSCLSNGLQRRCSAVPLPLRCPAYRLRYHDVRQERSTGLAEMMSDRRVSLHEAFSCRRRQVAYLHSAVGSRCSCADFWADSRPSSWS